jgi:anaerobic ribonucleoside-triphosphate reductase-activating protein
VEKVLADEFANVTFSGGDPMFQPEGFTEVAKAIKAKSQKTIWCYTGYKFEDLIKNPAQAALLSYIDVLVDGRYKQTLRDESLLFRGSSNQRLIDVQASLNKKEIVTYKYNPFI